MNRRIHFIARHVIRTALPLVVAGGLFTGCEELEQMLAGCDDETKADLLSDLETIADQLEAYSGQRADEEAEADETTEESDSTDPDPAEPEDDPDRTDEDDEDEQVDPDEQVDRDEEADPDEIVLNRKTVEFIRRICTTVANNGEEAFAADDEGEQDEEAEDGDGGSEASDENDLEEDDLDDEDETETPWTRDDLEELCSAAWSALEHFQSCQTSGEGEGEEEPERDDKDEFDM